MTVLSTSETLGAKPLNANIKPKPNIITRTKNHSVMTTDVLIIGAGLAGLSTALALPNTLNITILSKAALVSCSSHYAQGGIAASIDKNDPVADHIADTLIAGAGLCALDNTRQILGAGRQAIQWLCEQGVPFTQIAPENEHHFSANFNHPNHDKANLAHLHLTQEGGHGCRRIAHADDATGKHVMQTLTQKVQAASHIHILPYHEALTLLTQSVPNINATTTSKRRICKGASVFNHDKQTQIRIHSQAVVLASGGLGKLFQRATAPNVCVGDGIMMAWQAGCRLANLEFIQFHPTGLALGDSSFLISEALRGEGGKLYCPRTSKRFMVDYDERAELAPRDIVARAIAEQIDNNGLGYVHLDVSHLAADFLRAHFPQIYQTLLTLGIDITTDPIPVAPTAHYSCGGVVTCANGLTDVQGLYAAGEVAYTGLHGANRLASNSLLECVVVGRHIAAHVPQYVSSMAPMTTDFAPKSTHTLAAHWTTPQACNAQTLSLSPPNTAYTDFDDFNLHNISLNNISFDKTYLDKKPTADNPHANMCQNITAQLKALMTQNMGIRRSAVPLQQAQNQITHWQNECRNMLNSEGCELMTWQLSRQLQLATLVVQSAYQRCESRGGHYRTDYPQRASAQVVSIVEPLPMPYLAERETRSK